MLTSRRSHRTNRTRWYGSGSTTGRVLQVMWDGVTIVDDFVTKVKTGEVGITAILLVATKILRASSFHKQETQHAA